MYTASDPLIEEDTLDSKSYFWIFVDTSKDPDWC